MLACLLQKPSPIVNWREEKRREEKRVAFRFCFRFVEERICALREGWKDSRQADATGRQDRSYFLVILSRP